MGWAVKANKFRKALLGVGISALLVSCFIAVGLVIKNTPTVTVQASDNYTGQASVAAVDITQAGTGASLTVGDQTIDENTETTDNTARRKVLNNNIVRYRVTYDVTTAGTMAIKFTMPANSIIDSSSIAGGSGCTDGSSLESVDTKNASAEINKDWSGYNNETDISRTGNSAICIVSATNAGRNYWDVTTRVYGGKGEKVQPSLTVNDVIQSVSATPITVMALANYRLNLRPAYYNIAASNGVSKGGDFSYILYSLSSNKGDDRSLGIEPLKGNYTLQFDTSNLPDTPQNWSMTICNANGDNLDDSGGSTSSTLYGGGRPSCIKSADGKTLTVGRTSAAIGVYHCPTKRTDQLTIPTDRCYYSTASFQVAMPLINVPDDGATYRLTLKQQELMTRSGNMTTVLLEDDRSSAYLNWTYAKKSSGSQYVRMEPGNTKPGAGEYWTTLNYPSYTGEIIHVDLNQGAENPMSDSVNNIYSCTTFNPTEVKLMSEFVGNDGTTTKVKYKAMIKGKYGVEYGVIGNALDTRPDSRANVCGKYGDNQTDINFFTSLEEANSYAKSKGLRVNAMRVYIEKAGTAGFLWLGQFSIKVLKNDLTSPQFNMETSAKADEWSSDQQTYPDYIRAGLLQPKLSVDNSSLQIDAKTTIKLTPITYNNDTNTSITVTIPKGLSLVGGSVSRGDSSLADRTDCTVTKNDDGTTKLDFRGSSIAGSEPTYDDDGIPTAADNNGSGVEREPIQFDVLADSDIATPTTLTISALSNGDGTNSTADKFRRDSASISITSPNRGFGYSLNSDKTKINSGEDLNYTMTARNVTDNASDDSGLDMINVLPYDGDSRGSSNLASYKVSSVSLASDKVEGATLWWTTSADVRQIDKYVSASEMKELANSITWQQCVMADDFCSNAPNNATAIRIRSGVMASGGNVIAKWKLSDIVPTNSGSNGVVTDDVALADVNLLDSPAVHTMSDNVEWLGDNLQIGLDNSEVECALSPGNYCEKSINASVGAKTLSGYDLAIDVPSKLTSAKGHSFAGLEISPRGGNGYAFKYSGASEESWTSKSQAFAGASGVQNDKYSITFGAATTFATPADTYTGKITFTITAKQ